MSISDELLNSFAAPPGDTKAQEAYSQVKSALSTSHRLAGLSHETYLQGSYKNSTHIKDDSDVDVVVELSSTFMYDDTLLLPADKTRFHAAYPSSGTYQYSDFRRDVSAALTDQFGAQVTEGSKCFHIAGDARRVAADVLPCLEHRLYTSFPSSRLPDSFYLRGIKFHTSRDGWIVNWPRIHFDNGVAKNKSTSGLYKSIVRVAKNLRGIFVEAGILTLKAASSYHLECLIYNAPDTLFNGTVPQCFRSIFGFLATTDLQPFRTVSKLEPLFGGKNNWTIPDAQRFVQLIEFAEGAAIR